MAEFLDLPADVILIIVSKQHLDIRSTNNFREVCLQNHHLYHHVFPKLTRDVQKRGILKITEEKIDEVEDFTEDCKYLRQSALDISIVPIKYICFPENINSMLIDLFKNCNQRVTELIEAPYIYTFGETQKDTLKEILLNLNHLQKMKIAQGYGQISKDILRSVKNNRYLKTLRLVDITFHEFSVKMEDLPNLQKLDLWNCYGDTAGSLVSATAPNLTKLVIAGMNLQLLPELDFPKLKELVVDRCTGEVFSLVSAAASTVTELHLLDLYFNEKVTREMTNIEALRISECRGEISSLISAAAPTVRVLDLMDIDMNTKTEKAMTNLKVITINYQKIDISKCPEAITNTGKLKDLFKNSGIIFR